MTRGAEVTLEGAREILQHGARVYLGHDDLEATARQCGVDAASLCGVGDGDTIPLAGAHQFEASISYRHTLAPPPYRHQEFTLRLVFVEQEKEKEGREIR